jgi:YesN/AraC family two-component response regulator
MPHQPDVATRVLVVDDDESFAQVVCEWLASNGYDVELSLDGEEAAGMLDAWRPDVVLADIRMPRMDGLQLLDVIKAIDETIEVIFLSGQATLEDAVAALREGRGFDLLQKPLVNLERLNVTIEKALARNRKPMPETDGPVRYSQPVERTLAYITAHAGEPLLVRDLAAQLGYSPPYLTNLVRRETGLTIQQWMIRERLALGQRLLRDTDLAIEAVAGAVGYDDPGYFARQFRQHHGVTPLAWRTAMRNRPSGPSVP